MSALIERIRRRPPVAPPTGPMPPEGEALEAARRFLGRVAAHESARLARVAPAGDLDAARGRLAAAGRWLEEVDKRDHDFVFIDPDEFYDDKAPSGRRVRLEVVRERAEAEVARAEQDVRAGELSVMTADVALAAALRGVVADLDDAAAAEQLLTYRTHEAARALAGAEAARAAARRALDEACTAADAVPHPRTLAVLAMNEPAGGPAVSRARESLAAAVEAERAAAADVGGVEEQTRTFRRVVSVALAAERESLDRAAERASLEQEVYRRRDAR